MTIFKGVKNVILSRSFADFVLTHPVSLELRDWMQDILIPDEEYMQTLSRIIDVASSIDGKYSVTQDISPNMAQILPGTVDYFDPGLL